MNKDVQFVMLVGIAGSGKSTVARRLNDVFNTEFIILSSDDIREEIYGDASVQNNPARIFKLLNQSTLDHLAAGHSVVYDATNLKRSSREAMLKKIHDLETVTNTDITCTCVIVNADVDTCILRQNLRNRKVPAEVIKRQANNYEPVTSAEGWDTIFNYNRLT